ncbi:MAG: hypothetical protein GY805_16805 [Chloroflexi bacterium]|nr:hypothetical protein [Chloroflexota bacterium]
MTSWQRPLPDNGSNPSKHKVLPQKIIPNGRYLNKVTAVLHSPIPPKGAKNVPKN